MAFPAPDYAAGSQTTDPDKGAEKLFKQAGWIRRLCNEITAETTLNVLKIYQLAEMCYQFRLEGDKWKNNGDLTLILEALVRWAREAHGSTMTTSEMNAAAVAVYQAAGTFLTWATTTLPAKDATVPNVTVTVNKTWPNPDLIATVTKTAAVTNAVTALRDAFD